MWRGRQHAARFFVSLVIYSSVGAGVCPNGHAWYVECVPLATQREGEPGSNPVPPQPAQQQQCAPATAAN